MAHPLVACAVWYFCVDAFPCGMSSPATLFWVKTGGGWLLIQYLMKAELLWLPIVGWKAVLARDIFVHRSTQSSFRRLLKSTTRSLKAGNSIMTFPGTN